MWQLEKDGEILVHRVTDEHKPVTVKTLYGWDKRVPTTQLWHHKSCGQCGHIPGYSTSIFWLLRELGFTYHDPRDQTSCTAWNYYASATSNAPAQAAVAMRNFAAAEETGYFPIIHCATSFGHYKETRQQLMHSPELRRAHSICSTRSIPTPTLRFNPVQLPAEITYFQTAVSSDALRD